MLWITWFKLVCELRSSFSRFRTFQWFLISLAGITIRKDLAGVTSIVRALGILPIYYTRLLNNFHSDGVNVDKLTSTWSSLVLRVFSSNIFRLNGRILLVGDGIKIPKEGKKMPGVKLLHQSSQSNSKAEYIMGHSLQAISLIVSGCSSFLAVPLICRIHEGVRFGPKDKSTLMNKFFSIVNDLVISSPAYLVADAYYCCGHLAKSLQNIGVDIITRVKKNGVAYMPYNGKYDGKGRPRKYGKKIKLSSFFGKISSFDEMASPVYGEKNVLIKYMVMDLIWRPFGQIVRFCFVVHPDRGRCIFMTTDILLSAREIITAYGLRYKIEYSFKELVHSIGGFCYHFWMWSMKKTKRKSGDIYLHREKQSYRDEVVKKIRAYHFHIQMSLIAHGLLQYLAVFHPDQVWSSFGSWMRTIRPGIAPSAQVVQEALRNKTFELFKVLKKEGKWKKFIEKIIQKPKDRGKNGLAA